MRLCPARLIVIAAGVAPPALGQSAQRVPPAAEQIAAAVLPLPADLRAGAMVLGYRSMGKLETLRPGRNEMICLALYVSRPDFHVACYHKSLEPFMARGRELRAQGVTGDRVDSARFREIKAGKLPMPKHAVLYTITGKKGSWDPNTGKATGASSLTVVYMPFATTAETGLTTVPQVNGPWLMDAGTAKAHIMLAGKMSP